MSIAGVSHRCDLYINDRTSTPKSVHVADVLISDAFASVDDILEAINMWFRLHENHPSEVNLYLKRFDEKKTIQEIFSYTVPPLEVFGGKCCPVESAIHESRAKRIVDFLCTYACSFCTKDEFSLVKGKLSELKRPYFKTVIEACIKECTSFLARYADESEIERIVKFSVKYRNVISHPQSGSVVSRSIVMISLANSMFEIVFDWLILRQLGFSAEWIERRFKDYVPFQRSEFCNLHRVLKSEETGEAPGDLSMLDDTE